MKQIQNTVKMICFVDHELFNGVISFLKYNILVILIN